MSRRLVFALLAVAALGGCVRNEPALPIEPEVEEAELLTVVNVADARANSQLISGFHDLEQLAWRWTHKRFSVLLQPPEPVAGHQTALEVRLSVPGIVIERLGPVVLAASIGGEPVGSQTFSEAGQDLEFRQVVPEGLLGDQPVQVDFELDKAIEPTANDGRELGIIVSAIQLQ